MISDYLKQNFASISEELQKWYYLLNYILAHPSKDRLYRITLSEQLGVKNNVSYIFDWVDLIEFNKENKQWEAEINGGIGRCQLKNIVNIEPVDPVEERIKFALLPVNYTKNEQQQALTSKIESLQAECKSLLATKANLQDQLNQKIETIYSLFKERSLL